MGGGVQVGRLKFCKRLRPRNWSVRQTLVILTILFLLGALLLSSAVVGLAGEGRDWVLKPYQRELEIGGGLHTVVIDGPLSAGDEWLENFFNFLSVAGPVAVVGLAILLEAFTFYRLKLKRPIAILRDGAARIAENDLDFVVEVPSGDEMGQLCAAFETMRAELEHNHRELWRGMEERKRLNAAFAHDLRTPVTVLKGYTDLLAAYLPTGKLPPEKVRSTVACMSDSVGRLEAYISSMSTVQKLEDTEPAPVPVASAVLSDRVRGSLEMLAAGTDRQFYFTARNLPERLSLDEGIFFRVFENLAANALRYAATGVAVTLRTEDEFLCLTVSDDGRGFSPEELHMAAEPFYRDREQSDSLHLGLGLSIVKTLCEKHGGGLLLENNPSGGACVTARFAAE